MKTALKLLLGLATLGSVWLPGAQASPGWKQTANMDGASGVTIDLASPFTRAPDSGFMPVQIRIVNHSGSARTYSFQMSSSGPQYANRSRMAAFQTVRAENDAETRAEVLVPVSPAANSYRLMTIEVNGYGVVTPQTVLSPDYRSGSGSLTVDVGMSEKLSTRSWGVLEKSLSDQSRTLTGSQMDLTLLPPDWRALTGVRCLWLTPEDYLGLDAGRQTAIKDWVSRGGVLYVCGSKPDLAAWTEFGLRESADLVASLGFGEVRWFYTENAELLAERAATEIVRLGQEPPETWEQAENWSVSKEIGTLKMNLPFLLGFIGVFAVLIGPVNLFVLAPANRRHRLFWTTPAISLGASLLLIGVIILQDGFGGTGSRVMLTYLLPAQNKAVTVQEQAARTGVLFSRDFATADDVYLAPVAYQSTDERLFQRTGKAYGGDWFASRSLQAQRIEAIQQTRSRVQLLNAEQARTGAPPVVVSSLPVELDHLLYLDEAGRYWQGSNLRTGQQQTLQPETDPSPRVMPDTRGSPYLDTLLRRTRAQRGYFYALAKGGPFVDTLPSIRWNQDHAVFLGPVTTDR